MKATYINYSDTHSFSPAVISYVENDPKLAPFISQQPTIEGFTALLKEKKATCNRELLATVLKEQYIRSKSLIPNPKVSVNIELLRDESTYTITTGHQLNIFTGPLYFIYKIVTAINLAATLKARFPGKNFVPVYWMATEDHDFAEINHTSVNGKKLQWNLDAHGATGRLPTESIWAALNAYREALGISANAQELNSLVNTAYSKHDTLAAATRYLVNGLFGDHGLVIIDADDARLKKQFASVIEQDIIGQHSFREIEKSSSALQKAGFDTQVNAREINFFYMTDGLRERITHENGNWYVLNSSIQFSEEELKKEIAGHPERFSPNVVMRPLYQEIILPNIAYVGGGAEVVYWLQLKGNFNHYGIDFPILILRNSALLGDETLSSKVNRLNLSFTDIFRSAQDLKKEWVMKNSEHRLNLDAEWSELGPIFDKMKERTRKIDPTLVPSSEAVRARLHKQLLNLEKKMLKAEKRNHDSSLSQIDNIKEKYFPGGLQERSQNFGAFYVKYGPELISELVAHFKPLDFKFTILH